MEEQQDRLKVLVLVGPTAVGKTALSLRLALAFGGEIVSADSWQIYHYMDIGTAKATPEERALVPHHLINIVDPDEELTLAHYQQMAAEAINEISRCGRLPLLVGGTGLYVRAVTEGWTVPEVVPDKELRARLEGKAEREGAEAVHTLLAEVDPVAAARIDARNVRRVIRALEVYEATGEPISQLQGKRPPGYDLLKVGLTMPREQLYQRIDERVDRMMEQGLVEEVRWLLDRGYSAELPSMSGLGYRQITQYLRGEVGLDEAMALIKRHTRRFVRQQYNWFRLSDPTIHWFDVNTMREQEVFVLVRSFVSEN